MFDHQDPMRGHTLLFLLLYCSRKINVVCGATERLKISKIKIIAGNICKDYLRLLVFGSVPVSAHLKIHGYNKVKHLF